MVKSKIIMERLSFAYMMMAGGLSKSRASSLPNEERRQIKMKRIIIYFVISLLCATGSYAQSKRGKRIC